MQEEVYKAIAELIFRNVEKGIPFNRYFIQDLIAITNHLDEQSVITSLMENNQQKLRISINNSNIKLFTPAYANLKGYDIDFYQYLFITRLLLKEIENYRLSKMFIEEEKWISYNLQDRILEMSYYKYLALLQKYNNKKGFKIRKWNKALTHQSEMYAKFSAFAPETRYANIASYETILKVGELLELEKINGINQIEFWNMLLNPYSFIRTQQVDGVELSPTIYYLKKIAQTQQEEYEINQIIEQSENLNTSKRLILGLTLQPKEIYNARKMQQELEKNIK